MDAAVRNRFPGVTGDWARFDGPAGTQAVDSCIEAMAGYLRGGDNANGGGAFAASIATGELMARARSTVAALLGGNPEGVVFGPNMTSLTFAFTRAVARTLHAGDEIICTRLDHDANVTPWVLAANDTGATVRFAPFAADTGRLETDAVTSLITERTRWVAVTGASNAIGTMPDLPAITAAARAAGARTFVDAVHLVPHRRVDIGAIGADVVATSPYKWYGPHAGILLADPELLAELSPYKVRPAPGAGPGRWETGTPSYEAAAGVNAAAEFLIDCGMDAVASREHEVFAPLLEGLLRMPHVTVYGPCDMVDRAPTVAFTVAGRPAGEVAARLAEARVAVWSGDYYAVEVTAALGLQHGAVRAGVACYTSPDDVARLLAAVTDLAP